MLQFQEVQTGESLNEAAGKSLMIGTYPRTKSAICSLTHLEIQAHMQEGAMWMIAMPLCQVIMIGARTLICLFTSESAKRLSNASFPQTLEPKMPEIAPNHKKSSRMPRIILIALRTLSGIRSSLTFRSG